MTTTSLAIANLRAVLPMLKNGDANFATSLITQYDRKGNLSPKQWPHVLKLVEKAHKPQGDDRRREDVGDLSRIIELFDRAKQHLKNPAIVLAVPEIGADFLLRINVAGDRARVPGSLNVCSGEKISSPGEQRDWYGRILRDGVFEISNRTSIPTKPLVDRLREFSCDPIKVASEHGKLTGRCCFCNRALADERSTAQGYGPICADRFGLSWGKKPAEFGAAAS